MNFFYGKLYIKKVNFFDEIIMRFIFFLIILLQISAETIILPASYCKPFEYPSITFVDYDANATDGSTFSLYLLKNINDVCPSALDDDDLIGNCINVKSCSGSINNLEGDYTLYILNKNFIEEGIFEVNVKTDCLRDTSVGIQYQMPFIFHIIIITFVPIVIVAICVFIIVSLMMQCFDKSTSDALISREDIQV